MWLNTPVRVSSRNRCAMSAMACSRYPRETGCMAAWHQTSRVQPMLANNGLSHPETCSSRRVNRQPRFTHEGRLLPVTRATISAMYALARPLYTALSTGHRPALERVDRHGQNSSHAHLRNLATCCWPMQSLCSGMGGESRTVTTSDECALHPECMSDHAPAICEMHAPRSDVG